MIEHVQKAGTKRKRATAQKQEDLTGKVAHKLHHGIREVRKAGKKAKTFETQKLVKRLKSLRSSGASGSEVSASEAQLEIIKDINHELYADTALKNKLKKDRALSENPHVIAVVATELAGASIPVPPGDTPSSKVHSRLLSSKVLATEVGKVVEALRAVLHPLKDHAPPDNEEDEDEESEKETVSRPQKKMKQVESAASFEPADPGSQSEGEAIDDSASSEGPFQVIEDDEDMDDNGWQSGSIHGDEDGSENEDGASVDESAKGTDDQAPSRQESSNEFLKTASSTGLAKAHASQSKASGSVGTSTFLPSLSVGFTRGDSDASDWSDAEAAAADGAAKKNRRGQRARRAIWEKKYGKNANHVKKEQKVNSKTRQPRGQYDKTGATNRPHPYRHTMSQGANPPPESAVQSQARAVEKRKTEDRPLHPSWEAKKRMKEKLNPVIIPSQGKKIKF